MKTCPACRHAYPDDFSLCPRDGAHLTVQATETEAQLAAGLSHRFRIVRRLGAGGMGTVFLAEQIGVGSRPVALKVLNRKLLDDPDFLLRFQNEADSTGRIHHPNVVTIYESAQADDGTPYIAMEFLEGESLRDALKKRGALPVAECAEILQQTARGLNAAHKFGIIHRDLKPDNIFLTRSDEGELVVKVVDFGIAKLHESATHTMTGTVLGTPAYMSFEQASGMKSDELDARSDIYSLGVVVYEMLTARLPFDSDTPVGYLRKHLQDAPPPFRAVKPDLPSLPQLEAVVMKALVKDRDQRFTSALEFAHEFTLAASNPAPSETLPGTEVVDSQHRVQCGQEGEAEDKPEAERSAKAKTGLGGPVGKLVGAKHPVPERPKAVSQRPSRARFMLLGLLGLIAILAPTWHFWLRPYISQELIELRHMTERKATSEKSGPAAKAARPNPKDGLKYVWIPPGTFMMGCSPGDNDCDVEEKPAHEVTITKGFWMGQTPVTVGAYKRFSEAARRQMPGTDSITGRPVNENENMPIVEVSWDDGRAYCGWAGGRLPTEAEWEYAARGGSTEARYSPIDKVAWLGGTAYDSPHEVAQKWPNGYGLYDMLGNVWEWGSDWLSDDYYQNSPSQDPTGPPSGEIRIQRGGAWYSDSKAIRASFRNGGRPSSSMSDTGFRCAVEAGIP